LQVLFRVINALAKSFALFVGHFLRSTRSPSGTQKSFDLIFIAAILLFQSATLADQIRERRAVSRIYL
jgi:hypothetical protein